MALTLPPWLLVVRKVLGKITDVLIKGRQAGLYDEKNGPRF